MGWSGACVDAGCGIFVHGGYGFSEREVRELGAGFRY